MKLKIPFILVLASFLIHLYLMNSHYEFRYGFESQKSLCSINETLNCESVSISPYSYFVGLPLATWGMAFHLAFLFLFALAFIQPAEKGNAKRQTILSFIKIFSAFSLVASAIMGGISLLFMNTYCLFCIGLYVLSIANFIYMLMQKEVPWIASKDYLPKIFKTGEDGLIHVGAALIAIPVVAFLAHDMSTRSFIQKSSYVINDMVTQWESSPEVDFSNPLLQSGSTEPKFTIVEFADFQCIHCKNAAHNLHSFVKSRPGIQLQFYSFPLDASCNPALSSGGNGRSCLLAKSVFCAEKQSKGWQAHQWIFDRFGTDQNTQFEKMSEDLKLDYTALSACIQSEEANTAIIEQAKLGQKAAVEGTPAVFVNGKKLSAGHIVPVLEALYKKLNP